MRAFDRALKSMLFTLNPESAHHAALSILRGASATGLGRGALKSMYGLVSDPVEIAGLQFPNRVGLAAGYDKDATAWKGLGSLGFGHVEIGTVTPLPQGGNPKPRVFRVPEPRGIINRLGFPSAGSRAVVKRLDATRPNGMILGVNLGKNKATPNDQAADDYTELVHVFADVADYFTVNLSSPNTPGLRDLQEREAMTALLAKVIATRDAEHAQGVKRQPVFVKISPDLGEVDLDEAVQAAMDAGVDGIIATNTTVSRDGVVGSVSSEAGGLSGAGLTARADEVIIRLRERVGEDMPLIGVGGIMTPEDAVRRIIAGADLVQVYTGFVYAGPGFVRDVASALRDAPRR